MAAQPSPPAGWGQRPDTAPAPGTDGPRPRTVWIVVAVAVLLVVAVVVGISMLTDDDEPSPPAATSATTEPADESSTSTEDPADEPSVPVDTEGPAGTRDDPFAAGDPVTAGGWTTTIGPTDVDGWASLSAEMSDVELAQYAPAAGTSYVVAPMTVTYADGVPTDLGSFEVSYVGASGTSYTVIGSTCRLALDDLFPTSDVYEQAEVTGTVCTDVPAADAPGGTWRVALNIYDDSSSSASTDYEGFVAVD
ncbi:hypothetical protein [Sanguibacter sp. 25GB23B1]|uniref:hypothetical protein n=1 Tax=unclassified Sanguibacter TaxID=2645534 RepID=UPI0032AEF5CB